jgi:hypothetical protein
MFFDLFHRCHEKETNRYWVILDKIFYLEFHVTTNLQVLEQKNRDK